ncbi:unnamed protein product, partial [Protopolystoma xenopodis]
SHFSTNFDFDNNVSHPSSADPTCSAGIGQLSSYPSRYSLSRRALTPLANWFIWCQACRHGGHAGHLAEWFYGGLHHLTQTAASSISTASATAPITAATSTSCIGTLGITANQSSAPLSAALSVSAPSRSVAQHPSDSSLSLQAPPSWLVECPVNGCHCRCASLDLTGGLGGLRALFQPTTGLPTYHQSQDNLAIPSAITDITDCFPTAHQSTMATHPLNRLWLRDGYDVHRVPETGEVVNNEDGRGEEGVAVEEDDYPDTWDLGRTGFSSGIRRIVPFASRLHMSSFQPQQLTQSAGRTFAEETKLMTKWDILHRRGESADPADRFTGETGPYAARPFFLANLAASAQRLLLNTPGHGQHQQRFS